ncbi:Brix-domain-containing protein [Rickenella mellea]|uniref:Brix-domain-containing protein n=1 Tax=Rickenella mellea TaxID=50990 RepID=A0A4Y7QGH4_9AGAM|nr:Brix-domain-containing protein [Rickenella mellea]
MTGFRPSLIKNKIKREDAARKAKKSKAQEKLRKRLLRAKLEESDPSAKAKRLAENVPRTLDNTREFDQSLLTAKPDDSVESTWTAEDSLSVGLDFLTSDPSIPPKLLITTSPKAGRATYDFCDELVGVFPGAEFIARKRGKGYEIGRIAGWAAERHFGHLLVVNEDMKKPNGITLIHLPAGPSAYFKLTSVQLTKQIFGHARATPHHPELILNNFVTELGHTVGRMFQTLFPPLPEFQGRQVVTLHNQRDFLFFRRHRYAFRSVEKAALQEIGPRFTLKLRWLKKGLPAVQKFGNPAKPLEFSEDNPEIAESNEKASSEESDKLESVGGQHASHDDSIDRPPRVEPPTQDEYLWIWKPELETSRRLFFL